MVEAADTTASSRRPTRRTAIAAALVAVLFSMPLMGFATVILALPILVWLMYSLYVIAQRPEQRRERLVRVACWLGALAVIASVHLYLQFSTRARANEVVQTIARYLDTTGNCPSDLAQLGLGPETLRSRLGLSYFRCEGGIATLGYAKTYIPFETFEYDFRRRTWTERVP